MPLLLLTLLASCGTQPTPDGNAASVAPGSSPAATAEPGSSLSIALSKLDPASRALAGLIEPGEMVDARIDTGNPVDVIRAVRAGGGTANLVSDTIVLLTAPFDVVVANLARIDVASGSLAEDLTAMRRIAAQPPAAQSSNSGNPYAGTDIAVPADAVAIPPILLRPMLAALRDGIVTFDGRPYPRMSFDGGCGADSCDLTATGFVDGASPDATDWWAVHAAAVNGWLPTSGAGDRQLRGIPRPLARAAEWIARSDPAVANEIASYDRLASIAWQPGQPILIRIDYQRDCAAARAPGAVVAEDGVCLDNLEVLVDVATARVVDVEATTLKS